MDDDYGAAGAGRILRRGYTATRKGTTYRVKRGLIKDRGAKGRWQTMHGLPGIGPLKTGELTSLGYSHTKPTAERHAVLKKAVSRYGRASTIRKLNAIAIYSKRTGPSRAKTYRTDMHFVQKKFA